MADAPCSMPFPEIDLNGHPVAKLIRVLRRTEPLSVPWGDGKVRLVSRPDEGPASDGIALTLRCGQVAIGVSLAPGLAAAVCGAAGIGRPDWRAEGPRPFEAEIALDPVLTLLEEAWDRPVSLVPGSPEGVGPLVRTFLCQVGSAEGDLRVTFGADALDLLGDLMARTPMAPLRPLSVALPTAIEIGTFDVEPARIARLRRGEAFLPAAQDISLSHAALRVGGRRIAMMDASEASPRVTSFDPTVPTDDAGAGRVRLRFVLPCPSMKQEDVSSLAIGSVVPLEGPVGKARIAILAGDRTVGHGVLLRIGPRLAVQLRELPKRSPKLRAVRSWAAAHGLQLVSPKPNGRHLIPCN